MKVERSVLISYRKMYVGYKLICVFYLSDKYRVNVLNNTGCRLRNAHCERIGNYCICHCYPEHIMVVGSCLKGIVCRTSKTGSYRKLSRVVSELIEVCFLLVKLESV